LKSMVTKYLINRKTMALIPGYHPDYPTIALEEEGRVPANRFPFELIDDTLRIYYTSHRERKKAIENQMRFRKKTPMPIDLDQIFMFPTHAIHHHACAWISLLHVRCIKKADNPEHSIIVFHNNDSIVVEATQYSLKQQMKRTRRIQEHCEQIKAENLTFLLKQKKKIKRSFNRKQK